MEENIKIRGIVFRLYPSTFQITQLWGDCGSTRFINNYFLERRIRRYENGLPTSYKEDSKHLTKLKRKKKYKWLNDISKIVLQQALIDLDTAFQNFYRRVKKGEKPGFPKFKKRNRDRNSFRISGKRDVRIKDGKLDIPKISGNINMVQHRDIDFDNVKSYTVFEDCGQWFVSFIEYFEPEQLKKTKSKIGLDLGVKRLATTSNKKYKKPFNSKKLQRKIKHNQRELARRTKGSERWLKTKAKLQKLHQQLRRARVHYIHDYTTYLVNEHDIIVVEDLKVKNITKSAKGTIEEPGANVAAKSGLNREILNQGWGILVSQLKYKCEWYGKTLIEVNPKNTSQICSKCHKKVPGSRENQSRFVCKACGFKINADQNAARNILRRGLRELKRAA